MASENDEKQPIIIKRVKKGGGGHHGGAWKVAYADFVTAMMAFFLLLWLLNVSTDKQKELISAYFSPADPRASKSVSGSGGVMGGTTMSPDGAMVSDKEPVVGQPGPPSSKTIDSEGQEDGGQQAEATQKADPESIDKETLDEALAKQEEEAFKKAEEELKQAIESIPEMKALAQNLLIDMTPEGLRIQIVDQEGKPMFPLGSAEMFDLTRKLLEVIAKVVVKLPNKISIRGHTDSIKYAPGAKYTNWELSADRANAARRVLLSTALEPERIENVMGKADREHLVPEDPTSARNRRLSLILLKESIVPGIHKESEKPVAIEKPKPEPKPLVEPKKPVDPRIPARPQRPAHPGREEGIIYFP